MPSDKPPQLPLTEEQRDALLREMGEAMPGFRQATADMTLAANEFRRVAPMVEDHEKRIVTLEREVLAGVHRAPAASEPPSHLSPPPAPHVPSPRPMLSTHDAIQATQGTVERVEAETKKQTTMLQQQRMATAAFVGVVLATMLQQCQPGQLQQWLPHRAPAPAPAMTTAPATPPPASSR